MGAPVSGRRSLLALLQITSGREVAARCGVHPSRVSEWASGLTAPSDVPRMRLWMIYGISPDSWGAGLVHTSNVRRSR
jgi:transcriptional regulator with XRE-family HTH domain